MVYIPRLTLPKEFLNEDNDLKLTKQTTHYSWTDAQTAHQVRPVIFDRKRFKQIFISDSGKKYAKIVSAIVDLKTVSRTQPLNPTGKGLYKTGK